MKNLDVRGFTQLSTEEMQDMTGGGLFTTLLQTAEGIVNTAIGTAEGILNPLAAILDAVLASLPGISVSAGGSI